MKNIIIVGVGPRGLYALEKLVEAIGSFEINQEIHISLIEPTDQLGSGHVYDTDQPETNWINITDRALEADLQGRPVITINGLNIEGFPSYRQWNRTKTSEKIRQMDVFPQRAHMGRYLRERFESIAGTLSSTGLLTIFKDRVTAVKRDSDRFKVVLVKHKAMMADEVLLSIGHQSTANSEQIKRWRKHVIKYNNLHLFEKTYPIENLMRIPELYSGKTVALRGFGLAMIDVVRMLSEGLGGQFTLTDVQARTMHYEPSGKEPSAIIPFSLDGLSVVPKPLNESIDQLFQPTSEHEDKLRGAIKKAVSNPKDIIDTRFLLGPMAEICAAVYCRPNGSAISHDLSKAEVFTLIRQWLLDEDFSHDLIVPKDQLPETSMQDFVNMAVTGKQVSLDYSIGQVWRLLQPLMYEELAHSNLSSEILAQIVHLDERIKRYSYGPPMDSIQQLLALIAADILKIRLVDDPDIALDEEGWHFESDKSSDTATILINTVLDSPKLIEVDTMLVKELLKDGMMQPLHPSLGVLTDREGCVITVTDEKIPLALIGRLAKGTLLGVDAILECFGSPIEQWVEGVVKRLNPNVSVSHLR